MKAPFPWFGGKSGVAPEVWRRFGDVKNYVEPFFGSGAVLLARPGEPGIETVNDLDGLLCNFWRAVRAAPSEVAEAADWPVSELDLTARHLRLVETKAVLTRSLEADPEFFDARLAGWWVWGQCSWIGTGWCAGNGPWVRDAEGFLSLGNAGQGINRKLPHLGDAGQGINRKLPHLGDAGRGINRKLPHLGDAGRGIEAWLTRLSERLRRVRVACGSWERVLGDSVTWRHGLTGVFLDPPYADGEMEYASGSSAGLSAEVAAWARKAGQRDDMRVVLAGHSGEHDMPGWVEVPWTARGGYGNQGGDDEDDNRHREVVWFSPACLRPDIPTRQTSIFDALGGGQ